MFQSFVCAFLLAANVSAGAPAPQYHGVTRELSHEDGGVVYLGEGKGPGVAWVTGQDFAAGRITLEIQGADRPGKSFVGVAFHAADGEHYEAVYLRPFNFNSPDPARRAHALQYISMPEQPWQRLRAESPGKYEAALPAPPRADAWVKLELVVAGDNLRAFVNGSKEPVLEVRSLSGRRSGQIGLWVGDDSDGRFRALSVERK
jgi:hypothetical protein